MPLHKRIRKPAKEALKWLILAVLAAAIGVPVAQILTNENSSKSRQGSTTTKVTEKVETSPYAFPRPTVGYGPPRPAFRCTRPTECAGPRYVTFDSYVNNPVVEDERNFLGILSQSGDSPRQLSSLFMKADGRSGPLTMRVYIDNDTYQHLRGIQSTDATDTRLRLVLPSGPIYEAFPTVYLEASNAHPRKIWDTVHINTMRPRLLRYVPGSTRLTHKAANGQIVTEKLGDGLGSSEGLALGRWRADFRYAGYVTFKVSDKALAEPVRDPLVTRAITAEAVYPPPATGGLAKEPRVDGVYGDRFSCTKTRCKGPPFPELNAYRNHPLLGDEADFIRAAEANEYSNEGREIYHTVADVLPGDELHVRIAIDNGADPEEIGAPSPDNLLARDVHVGVTLPSSSGRELRVVAYLRSSNTQPQEIVDTLPVRSSQDIALRLKAKTANVLSDSGLRVVPSSIVVVAPSRNTNWGIGVGNIPPSFSKVVYAEFVLDVVRGR